MAALQFSGAKPGHHLLFWLLYYLAFSLIWAKDGNYYESFLLELLLLPFRMIAVYGMLYLVFPRSLLRKRYMVFGV